MTDTTTTMPAPAEIRAAVERMTVSDVFARSPQLGAFLRFVVEAVRSLVERARYQNLEIICVVDLPTPPEVIAQLEAIAGDRLKLVWYDRPFIKGFNGICLYSFN